jgi:hypothetical protein
MMHFHRFRTGTFRAEHFDALRGLFAPRKPRHPLLRLALGLVGVALLAVLVVVGLFVGIAMLLGGAMLRLLGMRGAPRAPSPATTPQRVVEGEYRIVGKSALSSGR